MPPIKRPTSIGDLRYATNSIPKSSEMFVEIDGVEHRVEGFNIGFLYGTQKRAPGSRKVVFSIAKKAEAAPVEAPTIALEPEPEQQPVESIALEPDGPRPAHKPARAKKD